MADQILSQEEIDALLSSMDNGELDEGSEEPKEVEAVIESYDLMSQSTMLHDQFHALVEIYDKFTYLLQTSMSLTLQKPFEVNFVSTEMVRYEEFIAAFSSPVTLITFKMEPLIGSGLLVIDQNLSFSLIDCMFSGDGSPLAQLRDFTPIEKRMMSKFAGIVLSSFEESWDIVYSIRISMDSFETKPDFVHMASNEDLMIIVVFSIQWNGFSGNIHMCIPYLMLEPVKGKLTSTYMRGKNIENVWRDHFLSLLQDAEVNLTGELGKNRSTVRDLMNLQLNDVIGLDTGPDDTISIKVEGVTKYKAFPGVIKGNRAAQLSTIIQENTGNSIYG